MVEHSQQLCEPQAERNKRHQSVDLVAIALCAVIVALKASLHAKTCGHRKGPWLRTSRKLPAAVESHDTRRPTCQRRCALLQLESLSELAALCRRGPPPLGNRVLASLGPRRRVLFHED